MILSRQPEGDVIAVMVVWNGISFLQKGLESVYQALRPQDDLLVVDNGSTDGSCEYIKEFYPQAALLQTTKNLGGAGGFNVGSEIALESKKCKFIWLLDNDIYVDKNALAPLVKTLSQVGDAAAAGSQICLYYQPNKIQEVGAKYGQWFGSIDCYYQNEEKISKSVLPYDVDYLAACSLLIRSDVIKRYGLFKDFFVFYDDVEWGLRIQEVGFRCLAVPESTIYHNFSGLKPIIAWREYYRKRNRCVCLLIHPPKKGGYFSLWINLVALSYRICRFYWDGDMGLYHSYSRARKDFLANKMGKRLEASPRSKMEIPVVSGFNSYFLDVSSLGDAICIAENIRKVNPSAKIYSPQRLKFQFEANGYDMVETLDNYNPFISILDCNASIKSIFNGSVIYRFSSDGICADKAPYFNYSKSLLGCVIGMLSGGVFGCLDVVRAIKNRKKYL